MNTKLINFVKTFSYTLSSNLLSLLVGLLIIIILPKFLELDDYGLLQLYIFYTSYIGIFHLGINDGIYLRFGGMKFSKLNMKLFNSQFLLLFSLLFLFAFGLGVYSNIFVTNSDKQFIITIVSLVLIVDNLKNMLVYTLQATNKIKEFAQIIILEKIIYVLLVFLLVILGFSSFKYYIVMDLAAKLLSLAFGVFQCREFTFSVHRYLWKEYIKEMYQNMSVGIKLMLANLASTLIIGTVRFGIERSWSIKTFGQISLILNISSIIMVFINAISIVIFPLLKNAELEKLPALYQHTRQLLTTVMLGVLLLYFPLLKVLVFWLPEYSNVLVYLSILFPIIFFESKISLLINTYFKVLRKESFMMKINILFLLISAILTILTTALMNNLFLAILSITLLIASKSVVCELYLSKKLQLALIKKIVIELVMIITFMVFSTLISEWINMMLYILVFIGYLIFMKRDTQLAFRVIFSSLREPNSQ